MTRPARHFPTKPFMAKVIRPATVAVLFALNAGPVAAQSFGAARGSLIIAGEPEVTRDLGTLAPDFRARLERVIDRMTREFGPGIEVVETWRSQSRQDALYAQGRSRPGPVVTWTRSSAHLSGYAADVVLESAYARRGGYARLAEVARAEGLRTLGPRDPGHLELVRSRDRVQYAAARYRGPAPLAGSATALSRIRRSSSGTIPPSGPTVFAASPYAGILSPAGVSGSFSANGYTGREAELPPENAPR